MSRSDAESPVLRRYLLGEATEAECDAIERVYFADADQADEIASAEDRLIEDYLDDRLDPSTRARFEARYLDSPARRIRVATLRRLRSGGRARASGVHFPRWLAAAAALLLLVGGLAVRDQWGAREPASAPAPTSGALKQPEPAPPQPDVRVGSPRVFALSLSSGGVRGEPGAEGFAIPAGTDIVLVRLEREGDDRPLRQARLSVRNVGGGELWTGEARPTTEAGRIIEVRIPAGVLVPNDYILVLSGAEGTDAGQELDRYFLRVLTSNRPVP